MTDPLIFSWESTPAAWRCYYDPEGPQGFGKTKEDALLELMWHDDPGEMQLLAEAIVAAIEKTETQREVISE